MSTQPNAARTGTAGHAPAYDSPMAAFIRGNYFYVLSAVAFLAGCYLLINAPFIAGTVFVRTLKSFLVLQGYEFLLLATAGLITWKIGRGGDVTTLFLIALVLTLDPTFFGNAFYTMRQGVPPAWPLTVCVISLAAAFAKFEIFRRLLRLVVSWRYIAGFSIAACVVWLAGLIFRLDITPDAVVWYSYGLAWTTLLVTVVIGEPYAACRLPGGDEQTGRRFSRFVALVPPMLCAIHQIELTRVFDIAFALWFLSPLFITVAFAAVRSARPQSYEAEWYIMADLAFAAAVYVSLPMGDTRPVFVGTSVPVLPVNTAVAMVAIFAYGYWKHRSRMAWYHLIGYTLAAALGALLYLTVKYVVPLLADLQLPAFVTALFSGRGLCLLAAVITAIVAVKLKRAIYWFFASAFAIVFLFGLLPGGYGSWTFEMLQAILAALFVYYYCIRATTETLRKTATLLIVLGLGRAALVPSAVTLTVLFVEAIVLLAASRWLKDFYYAAWGGLALLIAGGNVAEELLTAIHPSILALAVGLVLFAAGIYVTFRKSAMALPVAGGPGMTAPDIPRFAPESGASPSLPDDDMGRVMGDPKAVEKVPESAVATPPAVGDAGEADYVSIAHERVGRNMPDSLADYVMTVFVDDPEIRIYRYNRLDEKAIEYLRMLTAVDAMKPLLVVYGSRGSDSVLLITGIQLAIVSNTAGATTRFVPFSSIASLGRNFSTVVMRTHAGQTFLFTCDSPLQADLVVRGLEQIIVEAVLRQDNRH